jgi:hypothetical protein
MGMIMVVMMGVIKAESKPSIRVTPPWVIIEVRIWIVIVILPKINLFA